ADASTGKNESGQSGQAPGQLKKAPFEIDSAELARLEKQGHSKSDIYTALSLQEQTGVALASWLAVRKSGKTWPEAIEQLAKGKKLERKPMNPEDSRVLTQQEILELMYEGYSGADILEASNLLFYYCGEPRHLLELHRNGLSWEDIGQSQAEAWNEKMSGPKDPYGFGWGKHEATTTQSGLSKQEVAELLEKGFTLSEIINADSLAASLGIDFKSIAKDTSPKASLKDAVTKKYSQLTPSERAEAQKKVKPLDEEQLQSLAAQTGRSVAELKVNQPKIVLVKFEESETTLSGLTQEEVLALVALGLDIEEIISADAEAHALGLNFKSIMVNRKPGQSLTALVREADKNTPADQRNVVASRKQPTEADLLKMYANKTGKSQQELALLRSAGKSWREIMGIPEEELAQAMQLAESWGLKDRELVLQALTQGLWVNDAYQAALLAPATNLTASQILTMKKRDNTWMDVIAVLFPNKALPPVPEIDPIIKPRTPAKLPSGDNGR
ncbi:MAG: hypothetical protein Q8S19_08815, partial [Bacillota bacterium]|nr:hypothetical protein [Bacillota bacterium]